MKLYKYFSEYAVLRFLKGFQLRLSPTQAFNDPFESRPRLGTDAEWEAMANDRKKRTSAESLDESKNADAAIIDDKLEHNEGLGLRAWLNLLIGDRYGVFCMSEDPSSILMWGHYADCHRGAVVEFDSTHPFFSSNHQQNGFLNILVKVVYQLERPPIPLEFFRKYKTFGIGSKGWIELLDGPHQSLYTKSLDWAYEKEWRLIRQLIDTSNPPEGWVSTGYARNYPSLEMVGPVPKHQLMDIPPEAVLSVTVGAQARLQDEISPLSGLEEMIWDAILARPETSHIRVFKTRLDFDRFKLVIFDPENEEESKLNSSVLERKARKAGFGGRPKIGG